MPVGCCENPLFARVSWSAISRHLGDISRDELDKVYLDRQHRSVNESQILHTLHGYGVLIRFCVWRDWVKRRTRRRRKREENWGRWKTRKVQSEMYKPLLKVTSTTFCNPIHLTILLITILVLLIITIKQEWDPRAQVFSCKWWILQKNEDIEQHIENLASCQPRIWYETIHYGSQCF